jgi:hypothetical protein
MARTRTELTPDQDARIAEGVRRGETAERVAAALGGVVSGRTIGRRMKELRGPIVSRASSSSPSEARPVDPVPTSPEDIPDGATLPELADLLRRAKVLLAAAEDDENLPLAGQMIRVCGQLAETIRKATPPTQADPNDSPDMVKLGAEVEARFFKMIELVAEEHDPRAA